MVVRTLGQGGMGAVYLALDTRLKNMPVAIKEMSTRAVGGDLQAAIDSFQKEAQLLIGLRHPALPVIYDFFSREENRWYLVMDYIEGSTLKAELLRRGPIPEAEVYDWALQLCDILDFLHKRNPPIIFRDLKPDNIMLTPEGQIKLIDFGIARHFQPGNAADTVAYGSGGFSPPEQYGQIQTDARSDIYALGATIHYLLTGIDPSKGPFRFEPPGQYAPVSNNFENAIMKALELQIENRPQNITDFKAMLAKAPIDFTARQGSVSRANSSIPTENKIVNESDTMPLYPDQKQILAASPAGIGGQPNRPVFAPQAMQPGQPAVNNFNRTGSNTKNWVIGIAVVVIILLVGGGAFWLTKDNDEQTSESRPIVSSSSPSPTPSTEQINVMVNFFKTKATLDAWAQGGNFAVYIKDLKSGSVFSTAEKSKPLTAAGCVFLPIYFEYSRQVAEQGLNPQSTVTIARGSLVGGTGKLDTRDIGKSYTLENLAQLMMQESDNTAANILIDRLGGLGAINSQMEKQGMTATRLNRYLMDANAINNGIENYTSAEDLVRMLENLNRSNNQRILAKNDESSLPADYQVFHQVGVLTNVYNDASLICGSKCNFIVVVMSNGTSNDTAQQFISTIQQSALSDLLS
ncbi:MAG: serine hydrolase [Syntrophomonas sp.]